MQQELSQELQRIEKAQGLPSYSESSKAIWGLTGEENKIAGLKKLSAPFGVMAPEELLMQAQAAMLRVCVITGWVLPEDELQNILMDQFSKKLTEAYPNVNPNEFEYAFRNYASGVKDWGKNINLSLISDVMSPYLAARTHISQVEATAYARAQSQLEGPKEDISDAAMKEWLAEMVNRIKTPGYSFQFLPPMLYDWLAKKGKLNKTAAEKVAYLEKACQYRYCLFLESLEKFEDKGVRAQMNAFVAMVKEGEVTGPEIDVVEGITRRMILYDYLKTL